MSKRLLILVVTAIGISLSGCHQTVQQETNALILTNEDLAQRAVETRRFDVGNEALILSASAGVLQDLGFSIDNASAGTGLLMGSKSRDAVETRQVALAVFAAAAGAPLSIERNQRIRISIITRPTLDHHAVFVRATVQRVIFNDLGQVSRAVSVTDSGIYQKFFDKLSESVFLQAHAI